MNPFSLISSREIYKNPWMQLREDRVKKNGKEGIFGITTLGNGVGIVVLDEHQNIYLVKEFKYALGRQDINLPGGAIDIGESPLESAKRELFEELGIHANTWIELGIIHPLTTILYQIEYIFIAKDISFLEAKIDEWEETTLIKIPYQEALEMVLNGDITHAASVVGILKTQKYI